MSSSSETPRVTVLRHAQVPVQRARLDADLRTSPYARHALADPRLVHPALAAAVAEAAEKAAAQGREDGFAEGYAAGQAAARADAERADQRRAAAAAAAAAEREAATGQAIAALAAAADELDRRAAPGLDELRDVAVTLALRLTEELLGRELALAAQPGRDAVARCLRLLPADAPVTVRLHPEDLAALPPATDPRVTLVADPAVEPGGAVADCGRTRVDAQHGPALARVREALLRGDE